jgi:hypothetical protein
VKLDERHRSRDPIWVRIDAAELEPLRAARDTARAMSEELEETGGGGNAGVRKKLRIWLHTPPPRDVEGTPLLDIEPEPARTHYWARWAGSVKRIADLALTLQEVTGIDAAKPICVRWSHNLTTCYSPADFMDRVEEDRLAKARLIELSVAEDEKRGAKVRFCGLYWEPGAELVAAGLNTKEFQQLKEAVDPGRPVSSERVMDIAYYIFGGFTFLAMVALMGAQGASGTTLIWFVVWAFTVYLYVRGLIAVRNSLFPPLEIRPSGSKAAAALSSVFRWAVPGLPGLLAIIAAAASLFHLAG